MDQPLDIAVIGCGLGGAAMTALLQAKGFNACVFEQAPSFGPVGAGIHLTPNLMNVLHDLDLQNQLVEKGFTPASFTSRCGATADVLFELPLASHMSVQYGASYITIRRSDFHEALVSRIAPDSIHYAKQLNSIEQGSEDVKLGFADGSQQRARLVIAADGVFSKIRSALFDPTPPTFAGQAAYRAIVDASKLPHAPLDDLTKWWDGERFVISYYLDNDRKNYYFVAGFPEPDWPADRGWQEGSRDELLERFHDFHPHVRALLDTATDWKKWPLFERPPCDTWHAQRVALLGDACHPMRPHMAQGAAMAIEDAAVLSRYLCEFGLQRYEQAFARYYEERIERVSAVQAMSNENTWLRSAMDPSWVFAHQTGR